MSTPQPTRLPIPGGLQLTLKLIHEGQPAAIVLGGAGPGVAVTATLANTWRDSAWSAFRPLAHAGTGLTGAILRDVSSADGDSVEVGPGVVGAGSGTGPAAVSSACALLKWTTTQGGRSGKGRSFVPGLPQSAVATNGRSYVAGFITTATQAVNAYLVDAPLNAAGVSPAVLSFKRGAWYEITGGSLAPIIGIQRRRMRA